MLWQTPNQLLLYDLVGPAALPSAVRLNVADTGAGLVPEQMEQLFTPFNRLGQEMSPTSGTGIGLVVTKRLIELMGGRIGVESTPGTGSTFWVEMRKCAAPYMIGDATAAMMESGGTGKFSTVLYVEDNAANMNLVERLLERRLDLAMMKAVTAAEGIEIARAELPTIILVGVDLPDMNGVDVLGVLRADPRTKHIPVVAVSANAMPRDIERGIKAGFLRYVTKPIKVSIFMSALDAAIAAAAEHREESAG